MERWFHPLMTGKTTTLLMMWHSSLPARPCDKDGVFLPPDTPSMPPPPKSNEDWAPFNSRAGFKLAEFLHKEELSKSKIDHLLSLWSATLAPYNAEPPISDHRDLHAQIDSIDLGSVPWKSWKARYQGRRPVNSAAPSWMDEEYQLWYRDPRKVIHGILENPESSALTDYVPYCDFEGGKCRYRDFMSGDWCWNHCVRVDCEAKTLH